MKKALTIVAVVVIVLAAGAYLALSGPDYPHTDMSEVDPQELLRQTEQLLEESESWPAELSEGSTVVASSLDAYPVRTVRYSVEAQASLEEAIEYIKQDNYSGPGRRENDEKYELTLFESEEQGEYGPAVWVRRSVHKSPPPGTNRDAVVVYFEDRPDPKTYRIVFRSVESHDGVDFPAVEDAVRFHVFPSLIKIEEIAPGRVRIRKVEGVDPRGMGTLVNNYIVSLMFFRSFMFEQAKAIQATLEG